MKNKRIAIVANSTWNIYNFRLNIIKRLIDEENDVLVIAPLDEYISYKERFPKVKHIQIKNLSRKNTNPIKDLLLILELRRIYKKNQPDLIIHYTHKPNIFGGIAAKMLGLTSVAVITGLGYAFLRKGWINGMTRMLYAITKNFHKKVIFENEDDLNLFVKEGLVNKDDGAYTKGCGVDTAIYLPYPNGKEKKKMVFTFIGRLLYDKGILEFVKAAAKIKAKTDDVEFWVVGELDAGNPSMVKKSILLDWIDEGHIVYHGFLEDVRPTIAHSDCLVLPSYREGMPRIILEGMSMAKPVITTNVAGCRQTVVDEFNGFLVEVKSVDSLALAIEKFIKLKPEKRTELGVNGRNMVINEFNSEKISKELYEILSQV